MNDKTEIPTLVLGAGGYVGAEFVRLVDAHPRLELLAAASDSNAGQAIDSVFPHLRGGRATSLAFVSTDRALALVGKAARLAVFSAAPHGAAALERGPSDLHIVDASADFRLNDADAFADIYGQAHGAPGCLDKFSSGVPEHVSAIPTPHVGHPGCFATAMQLAIVPLQQRAHGPAPASSRCRPRTRRSATATCSPTSHWRIGTRPRCAHMCARPPATPRS